MASRPARLRGETLRFLAVGLTSVAIDFIAYRGLLALAVPVFPAKTLGFVAGASFAYFANRAYTFRVTVRRSGAEAMRFAAVYIGTLIANVVSNALALQLLRSWLPGHPEIAIGLAFTTATAVSATLNFIGMKLFVFGMAPTDTPAPAPTPASASAPAPALETDGVPRLSLVIPCYNEAPNLPLLVARLRETFTDDGVEVVLVDNGSTDATAATLHALLAGQSRIRSVRVEHNQGYGHGILSGLRVARGSILGWTHADMQTDPADVLRGLALLGPGPRDLFVKGRRHGRPLGDSLFTVGMSAFETMLLRQPLWDINAQPTLFPRAFFERWRDPPHDFALDLYAYHRALDERLEVARFPVRFGPRAHGVSHWNVDWRAKLRFIRRTMDFSLRLRRGLQERT